VVGGLATALVDGGILAKRLKAARARKIPVMGERAFSAMLAGGSLGETTFPLATALAPTSLTTDDAAVLAAFDLIVLEGDNCRFADAGVLRTAADLIEKRRSIADAVRILSRARDIAPLGRHKIVLAPSGEAALQWESGLTTLEGQGYLPLGDAGETVDDLFERAALSEAHGEQAEAARLYERCALLDRSDPIALYNLGNIHLTGQNPGEAERAYRRALERDEDFVEARYNLALALEALGREGDASVELARVIEDDPTNADALFNLAQLFLKSDVLVEARALYERYLALDPPPEWAAKARRAAAYCAVRLRIQ
jgi:tetratricopeptide (TPR) repeat protein